MKGLIQKSGYIQPGSGGEQYVKYIATRDGVERIESTAGGGYLEYMAERPRSHGLFSADDTADLAEMMKEISSHNAPVWTFIYSLRREDAVRLGYDTSESWRRLLLAHQTELAAAMKIPPGDFRWGAAFHDEKHHPHIHMMVWSRDPRQGYLTGKGIEKMRSELFGAIFQDELFSLYREKNLSYQQVRDTAMEAMSRLIGEMKTGLCDSPVIAEQMDRLSQMLGNAEGRKVYGYLKKSVKAQVDAIVDELSKLPEVAACYEEWNRLRDEVERYYKDTPREHRPLSRQKEFRAVKNMVIREAENLRLEVFTFEDEDRTEEMDGEQEAALREDSRQELWEIYRNAREVLSRWDSTETEKAKQVQALEQLWEDGFPEAAHQMGKCWRDGLGVFPDDEKAELWFRRGAEAGYDFSQYALGRLLETQKRMEEAVAWYEKAVAQGNPAAAYRLGKLYLQGELVSKDVPKALEYLTASAGQGSPFAQYILGKLYLMGKDVEQDREEAYRWFEMSAEQGNPYARFFLEHAGESQSPHLLLTATRLLHQLGQIFQENSVPPVLPGSQRTDRKLRRKIRQKKIALGQKPDDSGEQSPGPTL